jgi:hypothetical protein
MEVGLDYGHIWKWGVAQAQSTSYKSDYFFSQSDGRTITCPTVSRFKQKRSFIQPISFETKAIFFPAKRVS